MTLIYWVFFHKAVRYGEESKIIITEGSGEATGQWGQTVTDKELLKRLRVNCH